MELTIVPGLKITLLQQPLVWMDGPANLRHFDRQLEGIIGRDVIVLPEMFTTGFAMEAAKQSLPEADVVAWMHARAAQTQALIAGSAALQTERGPLTASCWSSLTARFIIMINGTCSVWPMNTITMRPGTSAWSLNGADGGSCRWSVTTCASRYGRVI
jgi:predicted amidohydrolase